MHEEDEKLYRQYNKLTFVEFLEFISRITDMAFKESELERLTLEEKLEYTLTDWLPIVDKKYQRNKIIIEEFSDSDEDY